MMPEAAVGKYHAAIFINDKIRASGQTGVLNAKRKALPANAKLTFWKFWFLGSIPWERKTVTPASLWHHPGLVLIHAVGVETPQPELTEAV